MLIFFIIIISAILIILVPAFSCNFYGLRELKRPLDKETSNSEAIPSNFSLTRKFLKRLYSDDFEIDTFGSKGFATWGRIIKFYSEDDCKHLDIKIEYNSTHTHKGEERRVLRCVYAHLQDDQLYSNSAECIFDVDFMKCTDSRSEKYIQIKKPYKFVEYIDKNFEKFERRKQQRLEEEWAKKEQLERENIKRKLSCI